MADIMVSFLLLSAAAGPCHAATDQPADAPHAEAGLKVANVEQVKGDEPGAAAFKFTVQAAEGTRFFVAYRHTFVRGAASTNHGFEVGDKGSAEVTMTIKYRPDFKGDRSVSVLMSQEKDLDYRVDVTGCKGAPSLTTIVSAPVWNVPPEQRSIKLSNAADEKDAPATDGVRRVLEVSRKPEAPAEPAATNPRSEILVGLHKDPPKPRLAAASRLAMQWRRQQQEVGSSHIKYRQLRLSSGYLHALTRDQVSRILLDEDLDDHPEKFPAAAARLINRPEIADKPWDEGEFFSIGLKTRNSTAFAVRVFDGELDMKYTPVNKQMDVHHGADSRVHRTVLAEFRIVPDPRLGAGQYLEKELPSGRVLLYRETDDSRHELLVDLASGFVRHTLRVSRRNPAASSLTEEFQYAPTSYPGRIVFPKLIVRASYLNDELQLLEMLLIDEAEFNEALPPGTFAMAAKAGTNVFIRTDDPSARPRHHAIHVDVADLAARVRDWEQEEADASDK